MKYTVTQTLTTVSIYTTDAETHEEALAQVKEGVRTLANLSIAESFQAKETEPTPEPTAE
jgi:uncharacterized protein YgfB (UPF0149 family)